MQIRWTAALRRRKLKLKPASFQVEHHRSGVRGTQDPTLCLSSAQNRIGDEVLLQLSSCDESWSSLGQTFTQNLLRGERMNGSATGRGLESRPKRFL